MSDERPATVATSLAAGVRVDALCLDCEHWTRLDLQKLADAGLAHRPLIALPLRCRCGSRRYRVVVSGGGVYVPA